MISYISGENNDFENASKRVFRLSSTTNKEKMILYGLYKQALFGNNNTSQPSVFNIKEKAKWDAWKNQYGKSKSSAKAEYVKYVNRLFEKNNK